MPETPPRRWATPPEIHDPARLRADAQRRRAALQAAGCQTYTVGMRGGQAAIVCLCCGLGSANPHDIAEKFCGFCRTWHSEWRDDDAE
jgi:hypothetical protein